MLQFLEFEFDNVQTILFKSGELVPLNSTQSKLLALLIANSQRILSKDDILNEIWQGKIVSEQVVFQNVSQLRAILGEGAIKTYPKKGYQWQLEITERKTSEQKIQAVNPSTIIDDGKIAVNKTANRRNLPKWLQSVIRDYRTYSMKNLALPALFLAALFLLTGVNLISNDFLLDDGNENASANQSESTDTNQSNLTSRSYSQVDLFFIPFIADNVKSHASELASLNNGLDFAVANDELNAREFVNSPYMQYKKMATKNGLLFTGILKNNGDSATRSDVPFLLELIIQGPERTWTSYLYGASVDELLNETHNLLKALVESDYFTLKSEQLLSSELSLINDKMPNGLHALPLLAYQLIDENKFDAASGYIELLLSQSEMTHPLYFAYGKWLKGQLYHRKQDSKNALIYLEQADLLFSDAHIYDLQAEVNKTLAEVVHSVSQSEEDYTTIHRYLYKAASLARLGKKPVAEIRAYTLLSIKASKFGMKKARSDFLIQAKTLLAEYQLDGSHYMLPTYHFALFAETTTDRIKYYRAVLDKPVTPDNYWVFFSSVESLSKIYLQEQQPEKAFQVIQKITEPARSALLHAQYYTTLNDVEKAVYFAERSFNIGRGQHLIWLSLNSALMLLELKQSQGESQELAEYRDFIATHASEWWLSWRKDRLTNVGIKVEERIATL